MLYIIRHGRTDWNDQHRLQGRTDIPLNEDGRKMAQKAAEEIKDVHFDICFCSPLSRASETAQILLKDRDIPIVFDERLVEMGFGEYEGISGYFDGIDSPVSAFFMNPERYSAPIAAGAESMDELFYRTGEFLRERVRPEIDKGRDVLIVGHGAMNSAIISQVKKLALKDFWSAGIENCKLMELL